MKKTRVKIADEPAVAFSAISEIELIVYDFDGVMTDNRVLVDEQGKEAVFVNRSDGLAVAEFKRRGVRQMILSTERNNVVQRRADKLKIECLQSIDDKRETLLKFMQQQNISPASTIFCGNDINDLEAMKLVGFPVSPADGHWSVREIAKYVTRCRGGEGVIRELFDLLTKTQPELQPKLTTA